MTKIMFHVPWTYRIDKNCSLDYDKKKYWLDLLKLINDDLACRKENEVYEYTTVLDKIRDIAITEISYIDVMDVIDYQSYFSKFKKEVGLKTYRKYVTEGITNSKVELVIDKTRLVKIEFRFLRYSVDFKLVNFLRKKYNDNLVLRKLGGYISIASAVTPNSFNDLVDELYDKIITK